MVIKNRSAPRMFVSAVPNRGGQGVRLDLSDRVLSLKYEDEEQKADKVTLTLRNHDFAVTDDPAFRHGMLLDIAWGYPGNMAPTRRCVVQSMKGNVIITLGLVAESILMNKVPRVRTWSNVRYSDIARTIAREQGYGDDTMDVEETPVVHETVAQARWTDAQFVRKLARIEGFEFYCDHEGFHFHRRRFDAPPIRTLTYFVDQSQGDILEGWSIESDLTKKRGRTRARGRNLLEGREIDVEASNETNTDRAVLQPVVGVPAPPAEASSGRTVRIDFDHDTSVVDVTETRVASEELVCTSAQDTATAERNARGRHRRTQQAAIKLNLPIIGDPGIVAKSIIDVRGMGQRLSGRYYVQRVVTDISGAYRQTLECITDGHAGHRRSSRVAQDLDLPGQQTQQQGRRNDQPEAGDALYPTIHLDHDTSTPRITYRSTSTSSGAQGDEIMSVDPTTWSSR